MPTASYRTLLRTSLVALAAALLSVSASASDGLTVELSRPERILLGQIEKRQSEQIRDIELLSGTNAGTLNVAGIRKIGDFFTKRLAALGFSVEWQYMPDEMRRAGHLFATRRGSRGRRLLLIGHLDTVFQADSPFQRTRRADGRLYGPGVDDMHDGNIVMLYALESLHSAGLLRDSHITVALLGDEEDPGVPISVSRAALVDAARHSDVALGFESGYNSTAIIGRRGAAAWRFDVTARAAHSARIHAGEVGSGAVHEAARVLQRIREELPGEPGLTLNPAIILGGNIVNYDASRTSGSAEGRINIVAGTAIAAGDLRFLTSLQRDKSMVVLRRIATESLPHCQTAFSFQELYPSMAPTVGNRSLLALYSSLSVAAGQGAIGANDPLQQGAADTSFVAAYVDTLDGLGAAGGGNHTSSEYLDLSTLTPATKRAALMIHRLTREPR